MKKIWSVVQRVVSLGIFKAEIEESIRTNKKNLQIRSEVDWPLKGEHHPLRMSAYPQSSLKIGADVVGTYARRTCVTIL